MGISFGGPATNSLRDISNTINAGAVPGGNNEDVQFNDNNAFGGNDHFVYDKTNVRVGIGTSIDPDEALHVAKATDGDQITALFENSQAADAGTNETVQVRFGFGGNNDVARIVVGKDEDYQSAGNENSFISFYADNNGTALEILRVNGFGTSQSTATPSVQIGDAITATSPLAALMIGQTDTHATKKGDLIYALAPGGSYKYLLLDNAGKLHVGPASANHTSPGVIVLDPFVSGSLTMLGLYGDYGGNASPPATIELGENNAGTLTDYFSITFNSLSSLGSPFPSSRYLSVIGTNVTGVTTEQPFIVFTDPVTPTSITLTASYTNQRFYQFIPPLVKGTAGGSTETITNGATVYISDAPSPDANSAITNAYAFWSDAGLNRFDGNGTHVFELPADATDPTGGGGAATGRIPVTIGGATRYLAYY